MCYPEYGVGELAGIVRQIVDGPLSRIAPQMSFHQRLRAVLAIRVVGNGYHIIMVQNWVDCVYVRAQ